MAVITDTLYSVHVLIKPTQGPIITFQDIHIKLHKIP